MRNKYKIIAIDKEKKETVIKSANSPQDAIFYLRYFVKKVSQMRYYVIDIVDNIVIDKLFVVK